MFSATKTTAAMTLVEVIVALSILSGGIIALTGTFSLCSRSSSAALRLDEAASIAEREIELTVTATNGSQPASSGESGLYKWSITYDDLQHGLVRASVTVTWLQRGMTREYRLVRIFTPRQTEQ